MLLAKELNDVAKNVCKKQKDLAQENFFSFKESIYKTLYNAANIGKFQETILFELVSNVVFLDEMKKLVAEDLESNGFKVVKSSCYNDRLEVYWE